MINNIVLGNAQGMVRCLHGWHYPEANLRRQLKLGTLHLEATHNVTKATVTIGTRRLAATVSHEGSTAVVTLPAGTVVKQGETLAVNLS